MPLDVGTDVELVIGGALVHGVVLDQAVAQVAVIAVDGLEEAVIDLIHDGQVIGAAVDLGIQRDDLGKDAAVHVGAADFLFRGAALVAGGVVGGVGAGLSGLAGLVGVLLCRIAAGDQGQQHHGGKNQSKNTVFHSDVLHDLKFLIYLPANLLAEILFGSQGVKILIYLKFISSEKERA